MFDWKAFDKCYMHGVSYDTCQTALTSIDQKPLLPTTDQCSDELTELLPCLSDVLKQARDDHIKVLIVGKDQTGFGTFLDYRGCVAHFRVLKGDQNDIERINQSGVIKNTQLTMHTQFFNLDFAMVGRKFGRPFTKKSNDTPLISGSHELLELIDIHPLSHTLTKEMVDRQIYFGNEFTKVREKLGSAGFTAAGDKFNLLLRSEVAFLETNRNILTSELQLQKSILKKRIKENAS